LVAKIQQTELITRKSYQTWRLCCDKVGRKEPGTKQIFGRDLRAAVPGLKITRPRGSDSRNRVYEGIGLKEAGEQ